MRKIQQTKILEILKTLDEAISNIVQLLTNNEFSSVNQILAGCQDLTASVLDFIEEIEGEGTKTAALLEEYYKHLYEASLEINKKNDSSFSVSRLKEYLFDIDISVRNELKPNKIEVVFLPYKAAMWDSLESIWLAAKDDPQCDAYVIAIPYYEKYPDGSLGNLRCDADLYPDYVPIVDWQTYDIEERHPDIIFFHNPYDDNNHVLSVYPDFHSKRLRNLTDLLVYVPYFVGLDDIPEHFCILPGPMYTDITFVQSKQAQQTYIRMFAETLKDYDKNGVFGDLKYKFIALGSPKFDKVINSNPDDFSIPYEWQKLIQSPNGSKRKIILYNTTVASILRGDESYLKKIKYVLDIFRDRDDVVLWWRPHPMNEATYQSMRPHLMLEYLKITDEYKKAGWGIYDDTADLHRSIAMSDAYYGDWSSVMSLYMCSGKPVMIQNLNVSHEIERYRNFGLFFNIFSDDTDIWFTESRFNALFKMNKKTWEPKFIGSFSGEATTNLYWQITVSNSCLFFAPARADKIGKYDIDKQLLSGIPYKCKLKLPVNPNAHFRGSIRYGNDIYFIPYNYPAFMCLNTLTNEISFYSDWNEPLKALANDNFTIEFSSPLLIDENKFFITAFHTNAVVCFNMETRTSTVFEVGAKSNRYNGICFDGENYWISPLHNTPIIKWNPIVGVIKEFNEFPRKVSKWQYRFLPIIYCGGFVWLLPNMGDTAFKIDVCTDIITIADEFQPKDDEINNSVMNKMYLFVQSSGDIIYAYSGFKMELVEYNFKTNHLRRESIILPKEFMDHTESTIFQQLPNISKPVSWLYELCINENMILTLPNLLKLFSSDTKEINEYLSALREKQLDLFQKLHPNSDGTAGKSIYNYCSRLANL